jgi:phosphoribosylformylglycinamidine (FGAM) synthase PurS component
VTVAKRYTLDVEDGGPGAEKLVEQVAREYLANPVSQTFQIRKL